MRAVGEAIVNRVEDLIGRYVPYIVLRGLSKDVLNEIDRNLEDACPSHATSCSPSRSACVRARAVTDVEAGPFRAVADVLEVILYTLVQSAGGNAIHALTAL
ncbi:hypothetical protein EDB86DRAFT_3077323 [Lactarius hatsudake]|nr:hypothetical protein EDB86DRAFT_3077323 [Lactarius hatsudake]